MSEHTIPKRGRPARNGLAMSGATRSRMRRDERNVETLKIVLLLSNALDELRISAPHRADLLTKTYSTVIRYAQKIANGGSPAPKEFKFGAPQ